MNTLPGILLDLYSSNAHTRLLELADIPVLWNQDVERPITGNRRLLLGDLVPQRQITVEVMFSLKYGPLVNLAVKSQGSANLFIGNIIGGLVREAASFQACYIWIMLPQKQATNVHQ